MAPIRAAGKAAGAHPSPVILAPFSMKAFNRPLEDGGRSTRFTRVEEPKQVRRVSVAPAGWLAAALCAIVASGCATAPPPLPVVTHEMTTASILRLEDQRALRDPVPQVVPPAQPGRRTLIPPAPPPPDLIRLLGDGDRRARRRAALAAGRVGLPEAVPALVRLLQSDPEPEVRQMAAFALGLIGDRAAAAPLQQALSDPSLLVAGRAAEALGLIGDPASAAAIGRMVAAQVQAGSIASQPPDGTGTGTDPSADAFRLGLCALARLKAWDPVAAAVLGGDGQPLARWWPVAFALQQIGDRRALPALVTLAGSESSYGRAFAARGLGAIGDRAATPALMALIDLSNLTSGASIEAIRALGRIGDSRAAPLLLKVLNGSRGNPGVRAEAVTALAGTGVAGGLDVLLDLLSDRAPSVRAAAFGTLARLDPDTFIAVLSGLDPDAEWSVRAAIASALGTLEAARALPRLTAMLGDADPRVIPAVLAALTKLRAPGIGKLLIDRLATDDPVVRAAAATRLAAVRPDGGVEPLAAAYVLGQRDAAYNARAAALGAIAVYGAPALPTLRLALGDKDWAVRVRAAELLKQVEPASEAATEIRPAQTGRAPAAYETGPLTNPTVSPHVFIETGRGTIEIELAVLDAPLTCDTFMALARKGYFDGLRFHRVVPDFVVQTGDPRGDGEGGPGFTLRDELNERGYVRGTVGLARDWLDSGGSQFFITYGPQPLLDARYTVFGQVVAGMDVVDQLLQGDEIRRLRVWDGVTDPGQ